MMKTDIYSKTAQRLGGYEFFSKTVIRTISELAARQAKHEHYQDFLKEAGIGEPILFVSDNNAGVSLVDIASQTMEQGTIVLHLPMANPLDENQLYHVATVAASNPEYRVIAFGNPSGKPYKFHQQNLNVFQLFGIAFTGNLKPLVSAELAYLRSQNITKAHHVGYSYGAHKALIESLYSDSGEVHSITLIDPVAHPRGFKQLIHDFKNTFHPLGEYVKRTGIPSYLEARKAATETRHHDHALKRPINIAIGAMLRRVDLIRLFEKVLRQQPGMKATVAWAVESELGNNAHMKVSMHRLKYNEHYDIRAMPLKDDKHALGNDIHLYATIIKDSL